MIAAKEIGDFVEEVTARSFQCASAKGYRLIYKPDVQAYYVYSLFEGKNVYIGNLEDAVDSFNQYVGETK